MTTNLRLHWDQVDDLESETLRFPFEAVREWPGPHKRWEADEEDDLEEPSMLSRADAIEDVERALDRMQSTLDDFSDQVDDAMRFPGAEGDDEPPAAA